MAEQIKTSAIEQLEQLFPGHGEEYENELYAAVQNKMTTRRGWDFHGFRDLYKRHIFSLQEHMKKEDGLLKQNLISGEWTFSDAINMDIRMWEPSLWPLFVDKPGENQQEILENAFYSCSKCRRKGVYAKNVYSYEKQTRSADEPMTVFSHCNTCGYNFKSAM